MTTRAPETKASRRNEHGNAFFYILLGVILFAALAFMISRGMRGQTTNNMSKRQLELAATDILSYAQQIARATDKIRRNNCSEIDVSFYMSSIPELAGYKHTPEVPDQCKIFHTDGGKASWKTPPPDIDGEASAEYFLFAKEVMGLGDDAKKELTLRLGPLNKEICTELNNRLNVAPNSSNNPPIGVFYNSTLKFKGDWGTADGAGPLGNHSNGTTIQGQSAFCCKRTSDPIENYYFFQVLIER